MTALTTAWQRRPGEQARTLAGREFAGELFSSGNPGAEVQADRRFRFCALDIGGTDGVAIHGGVIKSRKVEW